MFARGTTSSWYLTEDVCESIDFCVYALLQDGLQAAPFDQHGDGDVRLRAAGMTAESWHAWLMDVIRVQQEHKQSMQRWSEARRMSEGVPAPQIDERVMQPARAWDGDVAVGQRLAELWEQYQQQTQANNILGKEMRIELRLRRQGGQRINLWAALSPYHERIPPLHVYYIHYPAGVDYVVAPDSVLLSDSGLDGAAERDALLRAASALADGCECSWQRPVDTQREEQLEQRIEQLAAEAKELDQGVERDPLAATMKAVRRFSLGRYELQMDTLRVVKQKVTPEQGLYYITVKDRARKSYTFTCNTVRKPDGLWQVLASSGPEVALPPPVRILLQWLMMRNGRWLSFSGGYGIVYSVDGTPKNGFRGRGEIIAGAHKVARVRLLDQQGELAEDTVENGLVIFSNERTMQPPLYAELYDRSGKLVRRETVFDRRF